MEIKTKFFFFNLGSPKSKPNWCTPPLPMAKSCIYGLRSQRLLNGGEVLKNPDCE